MAGAIFIPTYFARFIIHDCSFLIIVDRESNLKARQCIKDTYKGLGQNEHALSQGLDWIERLSCCITFLLPQISKIAAVLFT